MKKSLEALMRGISSWKRAALRSASSRGVVPRRSAAWATGSPCSSVPVRKNTSSPRWRAWRGGSATGVGVAGEHVDGDRRVRVAQVGLGVYVVDRGCDVVRHGGRKATGGGWSRVSVHRVQLPRDA